MFNQLTRRGFLEAGVGAGVLATLGAADPSPAVAGADDPDRRPPSPGNLVLNDDGHVFLTFNDELGKAELRRYLQTYCRPGVGSVAYCVGDMSWPTLYPTRVGVHYSALGAGGFGSMRSRSGVAFRRGSPSWRRPGRTEYTSSVGAIAWRWSAGPMDRCGGSAASPECTCGG